MSYKATQLDTAATKKLGDMKPGQLFAFTQGDHARAICVVASSDAHGGSHRPLWAVQDEPASLMRVVVIGSRHSKRDGSHLPIGSLIDANPGMPVIPVLSIGTVSLQRACVAH
jgi:hypothetical protein